MEEYIDPLIMKKIKESIILEAVDGKVITYSELVSKYELPFHFVENRHEQVRLGKYLTAVADEEFKKSGRLISVIVVLKKGGKAKLPSQGFFDLAEKRGLKRRAESNDDFFKRERDAVFSKWHRI